MLATLIRQSKELAVAKKNRYDSKSKSRAAASTVDSSLESQEEEEEEEEIDPVMTKEEFFAELKQMKAQESTDLLAMFNMFWINLRGYFDDVRDILSEDGYVKLFTLLQFTVNDFVNEKEAAHRAEKDYSLRIKNYNVVDESSFYSILFDFILAHTHHEDLYFYTCFTWALMDAVMFLDTDPPTFKPRRVVEFLFANPAFEGELTVTFVKVKHSPEYAVEQSKAVELYSKFCNGTLARVKNSTKSRNTKANVSAISGHEMLMLEAMGRKFKNNKNGVDTDSDSGVDGGDGNSGEEFSDSASGRGDNDGRGGVRFGFGRNGKGGLYDGQEPRKARKKTKVSRNDRSYYFFANQGEGADSSYVAPVFVRKHVDLSYLRKRPAELPHKKSEFHGTVSREMSFSDRRPRRRARGVRQGTGGGYLKSTDFTPLSSLDTTQDAPLLSAGSGQVRLDSDQRVSPEERWSGGRDCSADRVSRDKALSSLSREKVARLNEDLSDTVLPDFIKITKVPGLPSSPLSSSMRLPSLSPKKEKVVLLPSFVLSVKTASKAPEIKVEKPPPRKPVRRSILEDGESMSNWIGQSLDFIKNRDNIATPAEDFSHHPFIVGKDCFSNILGSPSPESADCLYDDSTIATAESLDTITTVSDFPLESLEDTPFGSKKTPFLNNRRTDLLFQEVLEKKRNDLVRLNKLLHPLYTENNSITVEMKKKTTKARAAEIKYPLHDLLFSLNKREKCSVGANKIKAKMDSSCFFQPNKERFVSVNFPNYLDSVSNHAKLSKLAAFSETLKDVVYETDMEEIDFIPYRKFFMAAGTDDFQDYQQQLQRKKILEENHEIKEETSDVDVISQSVFHTFIAANEKRGDKM